MPTDSIPSPQWAATLPADKVPQVLAQLAALQTALAARLITLPAAAAADDDLIDAPTLAHRLGVPESHVRRLQRAGAIPFVRVGTKYIRFSFSAVAAALRAAEG